MNFGGDGRAGVLDLSPDAECLRYAFASKFKSAFIFLAYPYRFSLLLSLHSAETSLRLSDARAESRCGFDGGIVLGAWDVNSVAICSHRTSKS